jgi:hypothetical protein
MPNALEKLYADMNREHSSTEEYSIDELLESENNQSIFDIMGDEAKNSIMSKIEKVDLDEVPEVENNNFNNVEIDAQVNIEPQEVKRGRGRPRKEETLQSSREDDNDEKRVSESIHSLDMFMDSLAKDLIQELRDKKYETRNFSREQMLVILEYIEKKI